MIPSSRVPVHSAHVGEVAVVHYRWHPRFGQEVRITYRERRREEEVAVFETPERSRAVLPAWMLDAGACAAMTLGAPRVPYSAMLELRSVLAALGLIGAHPPPGSRSVPMKALPPAPSQFELLPRRDHALFVVEPNARNEILRALAELLLAAAEGVAGREERHDEVR